MTTFAVATPHALVVLTVSHDLLFRQPLSYAATLRPQFLVIEWLISQNVTFPAARLLGGISLLAASAARPMQLIGIHAASRSSMHRSKR
jgi:hypothetical protein